MQTKIVQTFLNLCCCCFQIVVVWFFFILGKMNWGSWCFVQLRWHTELESPCQLRIFEWLLQIQVKFVSRLRTLPSATLISISGWDRFTLYLNHHPNLDPIQTQILQLRRHLNQKQTEQKIEYFFLTQSIHLVKQSWYYFSIKKSLIFHSKFAEKFSSEKYTQ